MILLTAGLWPFNFRPENEVGRLSNENGILFFGQGMIYSPDPFNSSGHQDFTNAISIQLVVQSRVPQILDIPRILSFYDTRKSEVIIIGQWKSELILRYRNDVNTQNHREAYRELALDNALTTDIKHFITITSGASGTAFYLDGQLVKIYRDFHLDYQNIKSLDYIVLGNSPTGKNYWNGTLFYLAIYDRYLTPGEISQSYLSWKHSGYPSSNNEGLIALYLFDEGSGKIIRNHRGGAHVLVIPPFFQPLKKTVLLPPWKNFRWSLSCLNDITVNIIGFMPFGFFFAAFILKVTPFSRRLVYIITLLLGATISLTIELLQAFLPTRTSSFMDLICNTTGTALGVIIFSFCLPLLASRKLI